MTQALCRVCNLPLEPLAAHFACAARPHVPSLPERIGPYPILRAIGRGGMGVEAVRARLDAHGQPLLEPASAGAQKQLTANVAGTFYQVSAELNDPSSEPRDALMLGIAGLVGLCALALFLSRAARADHAE